MSVMSELDLLRRQSDELPDDWWCKLMELMIAGDFDELFKLLDSTADRLKILCKGNAEEYAGQLANVDELRRGLQREYRRGLQ